MNKFNTDSLNKNYDINFHHIMHDYPYFHTHDYWEFFFVVDGSYRHVLNDKTYTMDVNSAFLIRPHDRHALFDNAPKASHINILIKGDYMVKKCAEMSPDIYEKLDAADSLPVFLNSTEAREVVDYTSLLKDPSMEESKRGIINHLLLNYILEKVIAQNSLIASDKPKWLNDLLLKINLPQNVAWGVKDVLAEVNYSHSRFADLFKEYTGSTLIEYLTSTKMAAAHDFLMHSHMSILEISLQLGYKSISHFNHVFKNYYQLSPTQYIKTHKKAATASLLDQK